MLSIQEIQEVTFEKAVFGGYDMKSVDSFLEQLTEDYAALQKENAALKSKMKVLVDKIEEYKSIETGIRKALVSAQSIADDVVKKAKEESSKYLEEASAAAQSQIAQLSKQTQEEEARLQSARKRVDEFVAKMTEFYQGEIAGMSRLVQSVEQLAEPEGAQQEAKPVAVPAAPAPEQAPQAQETELEKTKDMEHLMRRLVNPQNAQTKQSAPPRVKQSVDILGEGERAQSGSKMDFAFDDLKFGKNYSPEDDQ